VAQENPGILWAFNILLALILAEASIKKTSTRKSGDQQ